MPASSSNVNPVWSAQNLVKYTKFLDQIAQAQKDKKGNGGKK